MANRIGKLIVWSMKDIVDCIDQMQEEKFDAIIFVEGKRGLGKSTLVYKICNRIKSPFNPNKDICYTRDEVLKALAIKTKGVIFADEMINVAFNRDFYEQDQKLLIKALNMYRDSCNVFIGCVPRFITLDNQLQGLCKIRLTVVRRGIALIQTQVQSIYTNDPWDIKNNMKIEAKWTLKGIQNPRYSQLTTVRGILKFNDLSPRSRALYEAIKKEKRNRIYTQQAELEQAQSPNIIFYKNLIKQLKTKEITDTMFAKICLIAGKDYKNVRIRVNQILKEEGSELRIKDLLKSSIINKKNGIGGFDFKEG